MIHCRLLVCFVLGTALSVHGQVGAKGEAQLRLALSEVQPGSMSSQHYCMLVFADRRFHEEKAIRGSGQAWEGTVYEGNLSDTEWNALDGILESQSFRSLNVRPGYVPLTIQNAHSFTISVRRQTEFQNMEFLDDSSRKPYDSQLKPLFQWWKSARSKRLTPSDAPADARCKLDSSGGVFSY
ncbi:MAG: hypothetical protein ABSD39_08905 [Terriglobales bacterium]|jgi:hypothetical protein